MDKLIENAPKIIGEAAKSPLGLFALMILVLAVLGFFFFRQASERTRIAMFVLIFVGVASFGVAIFRTTSLSPDGSPNPQNNTRQPGSSDCFEEFFSDIPKDRITTLEEGAQTRQLIGPHQSMDDTIAIKFTENRQPLGAIKFSFIATDKFFKIAAVIDSNCQPVEEYENASIGGDKRELQNWNTLHVRFGNATYALELEYYATGKIEAAKFERITADQ